MNNTASSDWTPFAKPVKYRITHSPYRSDEGWLLAWRICWEEQPQRSSSGIETIEYLNHCGDILADLELLEGSCTTQP